MNKKDKELTKKFREHTLETGWYKFINDCGNLDLAHFSLGHDGQGTVSYYDFNDGNLDKWCVGIVERVEFDPEIEELLEGSYYR